MTSVPPYLWGILAVHGVLTGLVLILVLRLRRRVRDLEAAQNGLEVPEEQGVAVNEPDDAEETAPLLADENGRATAAELPTRPFWQDRPSPDRASRALQNAKPKITERPNSAGPDRSYRMDPAPVIGDVPSMEVTDPASSVASISAVAEPSKPRADTPSFQDVVAAYNALAANVGQVDLEAFEACWEPLQMARAGPDSVVVNSGGEYWLIRTSEAGDQYGLVVPSAAIIWKWEYYYRSLGSMSARNLLEGFYEVSDGAPLRIARPAVAEALGEIWKVTTPGAFAEY